MKRGFEAVKHALGWGLLAVSVAVMLCAFLPRSDRTQETARYQSVHDATDVLPIPVKTGAVRLNHADVEELDALPGVGPAMAQAIMEEREKNGAFFYPEDLLAVKGIGDKKLAAIRDMLDLTPP